MYWTPAVPLTPGCSFSGIIPLFPGILGLPIRQYMCVFGLHYCYCWSARKGVKRAFNGYMIITCLLKVDSAYDDPARKLVEGDKTKTVSGEVITAPGAWSSGGDGAELNLLQPHGVSCSAVTETSLCAQHCSTNPSQRPKPATVKKNNPTSAQSSTTWTNQNCAVHCGTEAGYMIQKWREAPDHYWKV